MDDSPNPEPSADAVIVVPEVRDYHAINSEVVRHLDAGARTIRLAGVRGQRLLASGIRGPWSAVVEIEGDAGPELAAGLEATGLIVIARGRAADGAASRMAAGSLVVLGDVGLAFGYALRGGLAVAAGDASGRAGLGQSGGDLVILGRAGSMAGERQSGGRLFAPADRIGPHAGRGRHGGRFVRFRPDEGDERAELVACLGPLRFGPGALMSTLIPSPDGIGHLPGPAG